jgi:O-antigen ligase
VIKIIGALFASGFAVSVLSLFYFALGELTYDSRLKAFYLSPNYLAMYLTPILILSFCLWFFAKNKFYKIILSFGYISILIAIYLTDSYGAWLGFIGALIVLFLLNFKKISIFILKNKKTALVLLLFLILSNAFVLYVEIHNEKSRNLIYSNRSSLDSRLMIWQSGWEIIKDHPLTGIGPGAFQKHYLSYQDKFKKPYLEWAVPQPHNIFMAFYLQTTLLGFLGFIALLSVFLIRTIKKHSLLSAFLASFMIYIIIHGIIDTPYWKADLSLLFWSVIALSCIIDHLSDLQKEDNLDF